MVRLSRNPVYFVSNFVQKLLQRLLGSLKIGFLYNLMPSPRWGRHLFYSCSNCARAFSSTAS